VLLDQIRQVAEAEYKAGNRSQPDVLRALTELGSIDSELVTLEQRQRTTRGMLNQLMGRPIDAALPEPRVVERDQVDASIDALLARAAQHNPAIAKLHERIEQDRQKRRLTRLNRWPDLTASANYNAVADHAPPLAAALDAPVKPRVPADPHVCQQCAENRGATGRSAGGVLGRLVRAV